MTENEFILFIALLLTLIISLGRYAIIEGQRIEKHKKFLKNLEKHDNSRKNNKSNK
jgi:uncharacterized membrane protein (DUF106 family)